MKEEIVMFRFRVAVMAFALAGLGAGTVTAATAGAAAGATAPVVPALTQVRAAHHLGYDRLVFQFSGGVPAQHSARYVSQVIADASGLPVNVAGSARLLVRFSPAAGHTEQGLVTYGAARRTYALPGIIQVVNAGDFESVLSFGVGLARAEPFRMFTLTGPSRVVIDVRTPYRTVPVRGYFLNTHRFAAGQAPYTQAVYRPVIPPATAFGAMQRLFAGPAQRELTSGLRFVSSGATGFKNLTIRDGVARVQLTGRVSSGGSTFTIANQIMATLKQFPSVRWVKIYDQDGHTERPSGHSDSIPFSLEP
jgi:Sporulation and spore germination